MTDKRPAHRPRIEEGAQKRRHITLSDRQADLARQLGDGNLSAGIRRAITIATA